MLTAARVECEVVRDARHVSWYIFGFLICLFLFVLLVRPSDSYLSDPDTYWHIAVGEKIWQSGSVPQFDELSHTFRGKPWIAKEWLSQLILFAAYTLGGWRSVILITASTIAVTYALLFLVLSQTM